MEGRDRWHRKGSGGVEARGEKGKEEEMAEGKEGAERKGGNGRGHWPAQVLEPSAAYGFDHFQTAV